MNNHKKWLVKLTQSVAECVENLDKIMEMPSTEKRGTLIAKISNKLEFDNDSAMHFGLDYGFKKIENLKKKFSEPPWMTIDDTPVVNKRSKPTGD